jgi:hypothetical protein
VPFSSTVEPAPVALVHADLGTVNATLREARLEDVQVWERDWRDPLVEKARPDGAWPWNGHVRRSLSEQDSLVLVLEREHQLEGMISMRIARAESKLAPGADLLYVEYVGVAPINQSDPVGTRRIAGIGTFLVLTSLQLAMDVGCDGRVGLHSKPDVEDFYRKRGFEDLGHDETDDGLWLYFEMSPEGARLQIEAVNRR